VLAVDSATAAQWPAWARGRLPVAALGAPGVFFARIAIGVAFVTIAFVGAWNAQHYPIALGYDAHGHIAYAATLLDSHRLPENAGDTSEYRQPPLYYAVAGEAGRLGHELLGFPEDSHRGAQYLNVLFALATALVLLAFARLVAPNRPGVWAASLLFFAFLPVVAKTEAMFHPETLNMFLSAAALLLTTKILLRRRLHLWPAIGLAVVLAAGLLVRFSTLFTVLAIAISLGVVLVLPKVRRIHRSRRFGIALAVTAVVIAGAVEVYRRHVIPSTPDLGQAISHPLSGESPVSNRSNFFRLSGDVFTKPYRPNYVNEALPITYTEIWGDWVGALSWSGNDPAPSPAALKVMKDQSWIGVLPTLLAIGGWLLLAWRALRRRPALLALALMPLAGVGGYLYRSYLYLTTDGDLLKASYVLTTAPVWALGFGFAYGALGRFPIVRACLAICMVIFAILELRFMLYGIRDQHPIF
jgi:hypothetical protein